MMKRGEPIQVLLAEDNPLDILMISECLRKWSIKTCLNVVHDGKQALDFLHSRGSFVGERRPDLMFLNLSLPKSGGNEVLSAISKNPDLSDITIVVLTTFDPSADLEVWNDLGATLCITKPLNYSEYFQATRYIEELWAARQSRCQPVLRWRSPLPGRF
jgi:two-component system, chemotaxis family, response regulator Rcp1